MLRLRRSLLTHLLSGADVAALSSPSTYPGSSVHRLLSAVAPRISPNPSFAVEDYLVCTCGLTPAQALKASTNLSHLKSPTNPDAVLAFLAGLGLSGADIAALVARDPKFLCTGVDRTLAPMLVELTGHGLSHTEIARLVSLAPDRFRCRSTVSNLPYCMSLLGSYENFLRVLKKNSKLLGSSLEKVVKPNVTFLQECGLGACDIAKLCIHVPWLLTANLERFRTMVACSEGIGVPRGSGMFRHALHAVAFSSAEEITAQMENLKNTFRWSDAEVRVAVCKAPIMLRRSKDALQSMSEFLISEVGLEPLYVAHRPAMLSYSLEGRLRPRYYVVKFLKENGLLDHDRDYYTAFVRAEKVFVEKYIHPYKKTAPHLAKDYADACRGQVPPRFIFG